MFQACFGIGLWSVAMVGLLFVRAGIVERIAFFAAGLLLIAALPMTDEIGLALGVVLVGIQLWRKRTQRGKEVPA